MYKLEFSSSKFDNLFSKKLLIEELSYNNSWISNKFLYCKRKRNDIVIHFLIFQL